MAIARRRNPMLDRMKSELARKKADLRFYRKAAKDATPAITDTAITVAGGAAAGFVQTSDFDQIAGFDSELILGAGLIAYGLMGVGKTGDRSGAGKLPHIALGLGSGMLSVYAADMVKNMRTQGE